MTTNASRAPVDFDAFARDLQQPPAQPQVPSHAPHKADPLAELARIVGQDDPFRALLEARDSRADAAARGRIEPTFVDAAPVHAPVHAPAAQQNQAPAYSTATPADAFDQYLASVEQGEYHGHGSDGPHPDAAAFDSNDAADRGRPLERPRHRSRLVSVGAGLGVLAVCVTGALAWRGLHGNHGGGSGSVPTILADTAPLKVAPQKADGVEIPDQNKQIYDRTAKDGQIRIVNREEQPLDVAQAARAAGRTAEGGATPGSATPNAAPQPGTLTESLGEPRRVRTVSVKPDTPVPPPQRDPVVAESTATPSVIPTMTLPGAGSDGSSATASLRQRPGRMLASTPAPVAEAPAAEPPVPAPAPAQRVKAPQRVAAVTPEATSALAAPPATRATTATTVAPPAGSFSVQLGVRTTEGEAQAAFRQMQGKYSQLSGQPALIRQAEVNGKTIYRVRVGPLGKTEATSLCTELQGAGGQCFVARN